MRSRARSSVALLFVVSAALTCDPLRKADDLDEACSTYRGWPDRGGFAPFAEVPPCRSPLARTLGTTIR